MNYDFDQIIDRKNSNSVKWECMTGLDPNAVEGTIPLWVADMDFACAPPIIEALRRRVDRLIFGYSSFETKEYFAAVCGWFERRYGWRISKDDIFYSPGVVPAVNYLIDLLTGPGDAVVIQTPVYYPFAGAIRSHGRKAVLNPLINDGGHYSMDYEDLDRKLKESGAKLVILCSPHNPVGRVWSGQELSRYADICKKHGAFILSDEIHCDLLRRGVTHTPLAKLRADYADHIITATAPSKTFNLAGMQLSHILIHNADIQKKWKDYVNDRLSLRGPNALAIAAAQAAYESGGQWLEQLIDYLDENVRTVTDYFAGHLPQAVVSPTQGTYLMWADLRAYGFEHKALCARLVKEGKVLIEDGILFGSEGEGFIRMNVACPRPLLNQALEGIARVVLSKS